MRRDGRQWHDDRFVLATLRAGARRRRPYAIAAENAEIAARRAAERKTFTDAEIAEGFFKTVFGAELRLRGRTDVVRKYDGPVRVHVESRAKPDRRARSPRWSPTSAPTSSISTSR